MSLDLSFDGGQQAIRDSLEQFCADRCSEASVKSFAGEFPSALWREIADLGVLALATEAGSGGALEIVASCEALGRAVFPGPLPATFLATQLLSRDDVAAVASGNAIVSLAESPLLPWGTRASIFIEIDAGRAWKCVPSGEVAPVPTLGGESWGRAPLARCEDLGPAARGLALHDTALAAYLAAAADRLVEVTAEHVRTRKQFGRALGDFQAVAHPLADAWMSLAAATALARAAASRFDAGDASAAETAAAARLSATRAGLDTAHVCHQLFGALGITLEGPVFHISRRIRQLASQPPRDAAARDRVLEGFGL